MIIRGRFFFSLGGFGYDFSSDIENITEGLNAVAKGILQHGVTSFVPTLVTSPANIYRQVYNNLYKPHVPCGTGRHEDVA